jgi:hypothetical protein
MHPFRTLLVSAVLAGLAGPLVAAESPEAAALAVLSSSKDLRERARACQELAIYNSPKVVPALAALLGEEHLSDYARSGLESIADPSAGAALRQALGTLQGRHLAGVINSLGVRRDKAAVAAIGKLATDSARGVAPDAIAALGLIASADAAKLLTGLLKGGPADLKVPAAHAALMAAELSAKDKNAAQAKSLLNAVAAAKLSDHLTRVAQANLAHVGK